MARENSFIFFGKLEGSPIVLFNEEASTYRISFTLETVRRNGRLDHPTISLYSLNEETAKDYMKRLKPGVFVQIRGMVTTRMIEKPVRCEACGAVKQVDTLMCEIISFGKPLILDMDIDPKDIAEFSNIGSMIGSVCTGIQRRDGTEGPTAAQFQLAVNRRYRVNELETGTRTDYPWIKVFGEIADECLKRIKKSSQVYIVGAYQTRDIYRHVKCDNCPGQLVYEERVCEVVPNGVEFLNNCLFAPKEDAGKKAVEVGEAQSNEKT